MYLFFYLYILYCCKTIVAENVALKLSRAIIYLFAIDNFSTDAHKSKVSDNSSTTNSPKWATVHETSKTIIFK